MPWYRLKVEERIGGGLIHRLTRIERNPAPVEGVPCKRCGNDERIVRFGHYNGVQRYMCRACGATFMDNGALPHMKVRPEIVAVALAAFYRGMSLNNIRGQIQDRYGIYPGDGTIYRWVVRFSGLAVKLTKDLTPKAGGIWVADETVLKIGGENHWFWDIIDEKTRFLLASRISTSRFTRDAKALMDLAAERAGKSPKVVITDKLRSYLMGIEDAFGADTQHIQSQGFEVQPNTNLIERFHGTLKGRTKVMRGMQNRETAKLIMDGWLVHYNYLKPHEGLGNKTPAEVARVQAPFKSWTDVVRMWEGRE